MENSTVVPITAICATINDKQEPLWIMVAMVVVSVLMAMIARQRRARAARTRENIARAPPSPEQGEEV